MCLPLAPPAQKLQPEAPGHWPLQVYLYGVSETPFVSRLINQRRSIRQLISIHDGHSTIYSGIMILSEIPCGFRNTAAL